MIFWSIVQQIYSAQAKDEEMSHISLLHLLQPFCDFYKTHWQIFSLDLH